MIKYVTERDVFHLNLSKNDENLSKNDEKTEKGNI